MAGSKGRWSSKKVKLRGKEKGRIRNEAFEK